MKVIDLLNKMANNEEVPNTIKYDGINWELKEDGLYYSNDNFFYE